MRASPFELGSLDHCNCSHFGPLSGVEMSVLLTSQDWSFFSQWSSVFLGFTLIIGWKSWSKCQKITVWNRLAFVMRERKGNETKLGKQRKRHRSKISQD